MRQYGNTALEGAAAYGHQACVEVLLQANTAVDLVDADGDTALHYHDRPQVEHARFDLEQRERDLAFRDFALRRSEARHRESERRQSAMRRRLEDFRVELEEAMADVAAHEESPIVDRGCSWLKAEHFGFVPPR
eukprot:g19130.t1